MLNRNFLARLGPGVLFAGAAIGTSHLVQSTRTGALYGLALLVIIVAANLIKYPTFRFGPYYAAVSGKSLVEGYRHIGRWAVAVMVATQLPVHIVVLAATAITTAGIGLAIFPMDIDARYAAIGVLIFGVVLVRLGGYRMIAPVTKYLVAVLTITTLLATALALPDITWQREMFVFPELDLVTISFIIALVGFMPSPTDLSILTSLWSVEASRNQTTQVDQQDAMLDFDIGYVTSAFLALCFCLMGAGVLFVADIQPADSSAAFAGQVIMLYTSSLGDWAGLLVGVSAFGVMLTTLLTILDGFPRVYAAANQAFREEKGTLVETQSKQREMTLITIGLVAAATVMLLFLMRSFTSFIDFITITAFVLSPFVAIGNHIVVTGSTVAQGDRPSKLMLNWSLANCVILSVVAIAFLWMRFGA